MHVLIFCELGLKTPIHALKIVFGAQQGKIWCNVNPPPNELVLTFGGCYAPFYWDRVVAAGCPF